MRERETLFPTRRIQARAHTSRSVAKVGQCVHILSACAAPRAFPLYAYSSRMENFHFCILNRYNTRAGIVYLAFLFPTILGLAVRSSTLYTLRLCHALERQWGRYILLARDKSAGFMRPPVRCAEPTRGYRERGSGRKREKDWTWPPAHLKCA